MIATKLKVSKGFKGSTRGPVLPVLQSSLKEFCPLLIMSLSSLDSLLEN